MGVKSKIGTLVGALLGSLLILVQSACLTPEQQAQMNEYQAKLEKAQASIVALAGERDKFAADAKAALTKIEEGKLPMAEGMAMVRTALANKDALTFKIEAVTTDIKEVTGQIDALRKKGTPWWAIALPIVVSLAGIGAAFVPALSPIAQGLQMANRVVAQRTTQLEATTEAFGSVSRSLDEIASTSPELVAKKQELMTAEQSRDQLADKELYDQLRAQARAGTI